MTSKGPFQPKASYDSIIWKMFCMDRMQQAEKLWSYGKVQHEETCLALRLFMHSFEFTGLAPEYTFLRVTLLKIIFSL